MVALFGCVVVVVVVDGCWWTLTMVAVERHVRCDCVCDLGDCCGCRFD